jgi:outer membrane cobalamin receptor
VFPRPPCEVIPDIAPLFRPGTAIANIRKFALGPLLCIAAIPVVAQDDEGIDEIQVTATRRPTSTENVSAALTAVSSEKIQSSKLTTDALAMEPGIFLQQTSSTVSA